MTPFAITGAEECAPKELSAVSGRVQATASSETLELSIVPFASRVLVASTPG
jgi:hypothetical protein